jgi:pimeloyl-ACP methyl ester carboxylesterase
LAEREGYAEFCDAKSLATAPAMRLAMMPELLGQPDRLERLSAVRAPTLVLVGEQDEQFVPHAERMAKTIPDASLVVVPDGGHSPQFEATTAWWDALSSFLDDLAERH